MLDLSIPSEDDINIMLQITGVYVPPKAEFMYAEMWRRWVKGDLYLHQFNMLCKNLTFAFNYGGNPQLGKGGRLLDGNHRIAALSEAFRRIIT